jgi:hypothetical protein
MSLIIKKNTTFKIPRTGTQAFLPSSLGGLSLWLKADAGMSLGISQIIISGFTGIYTALNDTYNFDGNASWWGSSSFYINSDGALIDDNDGTVIATNSNNFQGAWTPTNYFSTITLSNAGEDLDQGFVVVNGIYTRSDASGPFGNFTASGGRTISFDDNDSGWWSTIADYYRNYGASLNVGDWQPEAGEEPAPTAVNSYSVRNVGSPTSTIVADIVTAWADQSGNGRNASPNNGFASLTTIGGNAFIDFPDGTDMSLPAIWEDIEVVGTILVVAYFTSSADNSVLLTHSTDTSFDFGRGISGTNTFFLRNYPTDYVTSSLSAGNNSKNILEATFDSSTASLYLNGTPCGSGLGASITGLSQFLIGQGQFNVAEIVVYNRVLTAPERQQVEQYLNSKYQIY